MGQPTNTPSTPAERAQAAKQLSAARALLMGKSAFLATLALSMRLEPDDSIPTACTDGHSIRYNPRFILSMPREKQITLLAHESLHPAFEHTLTSRRGTRDPRKWNMAGDYVINLILSDAGFEPIDGWLLHPGFKDMSTEHVYSILPHTPEGGWGIGSDLHEKGNAQEQQKTAADVRKRVAQASQMARQAKEYGNLPGQLKRMIDQVLNPRVDWRTRMRRFFTERCKDDYTWQRPNRRFDEFMPSLYSEAMGHLAVFIDVSGSIGADQFTVFMSETEALRQELRPKRTTIACCDTRVHNPQEFDPQDSILTYEAEGGGGTNMPAAFQWIEKHLPEPPQVCLIFTDMETPFGEDPGYPVLWVSYGNPDAEAPFGETVVMD